MDENKASVSENAKPKKKITKKWWFWVIIALCAIIILAAAFGEDSSSNTDSSGENSSNESTDRQGAGMQLPSVQVTGSQGLQFAYSTSKGGYIVQGIGSCVDADLVIPNVYKGLPVVAIDDAAFFDCDGIKTLVIPDGITWIGGDAFKNCSSLEKIEIADSVTYIGRWTFRATPVYEDSSNWDGEALYIGNHLIDTTTRLPSYYTVKDGTKCIASNAFEWCVSLESVVFPNSVVAISDGVLMETHGKLRNVTIGDNIAFIGESNFINCPNLIYTEKGGVLYLGNEKNPCLVLVKAKNKELSSYTVEPSARVIYDEAFKNCAKLTELSIPESVVNVGNWTFESCTSLKKLVLPNHISVIGDGLVSGCSSLVEMPIPSTVRSIGAHSFSGCSALTAIVLPEGLQHIDIWAFYDCSSIQSITIPQRVWSLDASAFFNCSKLERIEVASENTVFSSVDGNVYSKDGETLICYASGKQQESFTVSKNVKTIANDAFAYCTQLKEVVLPAGLKEIEANAFLCCKGLTQLVLPDTLEKIGGWAFNDCLGITQMIIPQSVTAIGYNPFPNSLTALLYSGSYDQWTLLEKDENLNYAVSGVICYYDESEEFSVERTWYYQDGVPMIRE